MHNGDGLGKVKVVGFYKNLDNRYNLDLYKIVQERMSRLPFYIKVQGTKGLLSKLEASTAGLLKLCSNQIQHNSRSVFTGITSLDGVADHWPPAEAKKMPS